MEFQCSRMQPCCCSMPRTSGRVQCFFLRKKKQKPKRTSYSLNGTCGLGDKLEQDLRTEQNGRIDACMNFPEDRGQVAKRPVLKSGGGSGSVLQK